MLAADVYRGDTSRGSPAPATVSFEDVVRQQYGRLFRVAVMLAGDEGHAEDIVQEALLRAHRRWDTASRAPVPYLLTIVRNLARDRYRAAARRPQESPLFDTDGAAYDPTASVADQQAVRRAITTLPERQRAAVVLRYFEDLSTAETARILDCSQGTVKTHLSRALASLERLLGHEPASEGGGSTRGGAP
jgi:RNA polymerase sigma-70 factor (sigma-E family)